MGGEKSLVGREMGQGWTKKKKGAPGIKKQGSITSGKKGKKRDRSGEGRRTGSGRELPEPSTKYKTITDELLHLINQKNNYRHHN